MSGIEHQEMKENQRENVINDRKEKQKKKKQ